MFPHSFISSDGLEQMLHPHQHYMPTPMERSRWKPSIEVAPNCPRCASTNTKFCYYNNYSLSQPRYFCKGCRRYWTKGGSLRNVPVGGGCRKNRRGKSSSSRHHQSQRLFSSVDSEDTQSSSVGEAQQKGSRDIDMALVFAKFLKPTSSTAGHRDKNVSSKNYLTPESIEIENDSVVQPQDKDLSGPVTVESANFELSLGEIDELERLLGDEDGLWSDATLSSSVTWEPPLKQIQLHELEYSLNEEDHGQLLPITSASTMGDTCWSNWTSFDLSTMEKLSPSP